MPVQVELQQAQQARQAAQRAAAQADQALAEHRRAAQATTAELQVRRGSGLALCALDAWSVLCALGEALRGHFLRRL